MNRNGDPPIRVRNSMRTCIVHSKSPKATRFQAEAPREMPLNTPPKRAIGLTGDIVPGRLIGVGPRGQCSRETVVRLDPRLGVCRPCTDDRRPGGRRDPSRDAFRPLQSMEAPIAEHAEPRRLALCQRRMRC